jgi:hypothetical protein
MSDYDNFISINLNFKSDFFSLSYISNILTAQNDTSWQSEEIGRRYGWDTGRPW